MTDMPTIITGEQADQAFGHLTQRDPELMRIQTEQAFAKMREQTLTAANALLFVGLRNKTGGRQ